MLKKKILIYIGFFLPVLLWGNTIEVCKTCNINSIKKAIELAKDGDTVIVASGTYVEYDILITKSIILIGQDYPIIDGDKKGQIIRVSANNFVIDGFIIKNVGRSYIKDFAGILVNRSKNFVIRNMKLSNVFFGILIEKSKNGIIEHNIVKSAAIDEANSGNGVHLWHCDSMIVRENELYNLRDGIYFEFVKHSKIYNNYSHNNLRYGLHFMFSNYDEYYDNVFENNGSGVAVMFSKFINMHDNKFANNWGTASYGLLLKEIYDAEIYNNTFENNTIGITVEGSTRINYFKNTFMNNGWALKVSGACYLNEFKYNNFMFNAFDLSYNGKINDNFFDANYWSEYTGYDLDKDGIGDVPYRPVKLFSYIVNKTPETIILLRSLFVDIINFSEKVTPVFTPDDLIDKNPSMKML